MMKKSLAVIATSLLTISSVFACWFTQDNFENAYFAGLNYFYEHYFNASEAVAKPINTAFYVNGKMDTNGNVSSYYKVSLPITPWFKVSPRVQTVNGQPQIYYIRKAKLFYKIVPGNTNSNAASAKWRLAKSIDMGANPKWFLDFKSPVKLFGNNVITKELIESKGDTINKNDGIILVWWIADNSPSAIMNGDEIIEGQTSPNILPTLKEDYQVTYTGDYRPAYVMRVVYNGKNIKLGR